MTSNRSPRFHSSTLHLVVMTMLYIGQGFLQGCCSISFSLLRAAGYAPTPHQQATLTLPLYWFSAKFLWAPFVDRAAFNRQTRRPLWVLACQGALTAGFVALWRGAAAWEAVANGSGGAGAAAAPPVPLDDGAFRLLAGALAALALLSATQDVAVDAWAVEGVAPSHVAHAGTAQTIGLCIGITLTQLAVVVIESRAMSLPDFLGVVACVYLLVLALIVGYVGTATYRAALVEAERHRLVARRGGGDGGTASANPLRSVVALWRHPRHGRLIAILAVCSVPAVAWNLASAQLVEVAGLPASFLPSCSPFFLPLDLFVASATSAYLSSGRSSAGGGGPPLAPLALFFGAAPAWSRC